jgi:hypothetical protein
MHADEASTPVDVITEHHHYAGRIVTGGVRLSDILSDTRLDVLEMHDTVLRGEGARSTELRCGQMFLKKNALLLVIPQGSHEAPIRRRNNYQKKERYGAVIALPGLVISGIVHLPPRASPWILLDENAALPRFFGLTQVTIHSSIHPSVPSQCPTAILYRDAIQSVQLTDKPLPDQPKTEERSQEPGVRSQKTEVRSQKTEVRRAEDPDRRPLFTLTPDS